MRPASTSSTDAAGEPPALLEIGRVVRPHGLRGEVVVQLVTNRLERIAVGSQLVVRRPGSEDETAVVEAARPHSRRHLVRFTSVADIDGAEALRNAVLLAEPLEDAGALFVHELIGAEVVDLSGARLGQVETVEANPASDLLVLEGGGLVPLVFVVRREGDRLVVDPPEGLLE